MQAWPRLSSRLNRVLTIVGAALLLAISLGITAEVLMRKLFNASLGGMDELSSYGFAIFTSFPLSVAVLARANIRIDLFRSMAPVAVRIGLDLLAQLALIGFAGFLTWRALLMASMSWENGTKAITPLATPVAWPQTIWLFGLVIFLLVLLVMLGLSIRALFCGDVAAFFGLAGPVSELDEIDLSEVTGATTPKSSPPEI
ncbi:MAG: TRAP transporter small permease subunit [Haliea sp.]